MPLGTIHDSDLNLFIEYLIPGISQAEIDKLEPRHRARIREDLMEVVMADNYNRGAGIEGVIKDLNTARDQLAVIRAGKTQSLLDAEAQGANKINPLSLIGIASFTIAAVVTATVASSKMKKMYDELMDDLNAGFPAPNWQDDAPDKGDVVPFYNTESIEKIIDGFNALRSKASAYPNDESRFSKADFPPMVEFGTRTDTEQETAISRKEKRAREEIGKVEEAAKTYVKQDTADGIHAKPFFNSDVIDNVAGGLANLAGMSTAAYLHYKSIIQQPISFPPLMNFGTFTSPIDQEVGNPTVDRVQLASDFLKTATDFYSMYKQYTNQTTTQKEVEQPPEKAPLPVEEKVPEMEPVTEEVPPVEEVLPEKNHLPDETSPPPVEVPPVEEVPSILTALPKEDALLPELQADEIEIGEGEEETGEVTVHPAIDKQIEETEAVEPVVSESVITQLIEPHIKNALSKGLSATQVATFSPVLADVISAIISSNETLYTATANALLESTVAGMLSKVMPHTQGLKAAPVLMDAVSAAIKNNASFETASSEVLEAAILPILSVAATGWLTPYFGFGLSAVIGTAGSCLVYDTAKNVAVATMDAIKKVDEIKREIREAEEAKNKAAEQNAPPPVTLQSMQKLPDQVIIEEIEDSLQTTQSVKRAMYAQEDNTLSDNKHTLVEKTSIGDDIKEELFNNKRRKLPQPSSDTRLVFARNVDLNGMPVSYNRQYVLRRAADELRTPLI